MLMKTLRIATALAMLGTAQLGASPALAMPSECMRDARAYADARAQRGTPEWDDAYDEYYEPCLLRTRVCGTDENGNYGCDNPGVNG